MAAHSALAAALAGARDPRRHHGASGPVASLVRAWLPHLRLYREYCANQPRARHLLDRKKDTPGVAHVLSCAGDLRLSRRMDLWAFLDLPRRHCQRLPLLLDTIVKCVRVCVRG